MEKFSTEYFHKLANDLKFDLSDEEIENGIVGAGNDGGCDGIYIFLNKKHILINSKCAHNL